ncbi:MAG: hypothetical protein HFI70_13490 [Lachnospiraceae bacterium]|nr:hypothetical protein [Lachnospiraceae bacterium]
MKKSEWILCPVCGNKFRNRLREDTVLKNYHSRRSGGRKDNIYTEYSGETV